MILKDALRRSFFRGDCRRYREKHVSTGLVAGRSCSPAEPRSNKPSGAGSRCGSNLHRPLPRPRRPRNRSTARRAARGIPRWERTRIGHKPHHLEAIGQVFAQSADMNVHDSERLGDLVRGCRSGGCGTQRHRRQPRPRHRDHAGRRQCRVAGKPANPGTTPGSPATTAPGKSSEETPAKPKRPIDLTARSIEAHSSAPANGTIWKRSGAKGTSV